MGRRGRAALARRLVALPLLALVLAGCGSEGSDTDTDGTTSSGSRLLTEADLAPLEPASTRVVDDLQDGSPYWSCGGVEFRGLFDAGLRTKGRYFLSGADDWAVYSVLLTVPDLPAEEALETMKRAHAACARKGQTMPELDLGQDRWGYRSEGEGRTEARRGYAVVGEHQLVQVSVFGLEGKDAPDQVQELLERAVERAG
jgi:hypothetical protein